VNPTETDQSQEQLPQQLLAYPSWVSVLLGELEEGGQHSFLLHSNVHDLIVRPPGPNGERARALAVLPLLSAVLRSPGPGDRTRRPVQGRPLILEYSSSLGIRGTWNRALKEESNQTSLSDTETASLANRAAAVNDVNAGLRSVGSRLRELGGKRAVRGVPDFEVRPETGTMQEVIADFELLERILLAPWDAAGLPGPALFVPRLEYLAPVTETDRESLQQHLFAIERLLLWARDERMAQLNVAILMFASDLGRIHRDLITTDSRIGAIRVDLPREAERFAFLQYLSNEEDLTRSLPTLGRGAYTEKELREFANRSSGFSLQALAALARKVRAQIAQFEQLKNDWAAQGALPKRAPNAADYYLAFDAEHIAREKKHVIDASSGGLLENIQATGGLDQLKGQPRASRELDQLAQDVEEMRLAGRHRNMLFVGPPGTGKSLGAKGLAAESGMNMVQLRDIQSKYVGESERNLTRVLDLITALAPVVVFVDEIDQALPGRQTGPAGDSGVGQRMFSTLLQFMADPKNAGQVIFVAASNRADLLDPALLSRFQYVIPFLLPNGKGREDILWELGQMKKSRMSFSFREDGWSSDRNLIQVIKATGGSQKIVSPPPSGAGFDVARFREWIREVEVGLSGRELDLVLDHAVDIAERAGSYSDDTAGATGSPEATIRRALVQPEHLAAAAAGYTANHDHLEYIRQELIALSLCSFECQRPDWEVIQEKPYAPFITRDGRQVDPRFLALATETINSLIQDDRIARST
jgi:SpoVK/Ycf46/Vps4 family AAA+-type ATPase